MDIGALVRMLRSDDEAARLNALRGLEMSRDPRVPEVLRVLSSRDPSPRVRYEARKAYDRITGGIHGQQSSEAAIAGGVRGPAGQGAPPEGDCGRSKPDGVAAQGRQGGESRSSGGTPGGRSCTDGERESGAPVDFLDFRTFVTAYRNAGVEERIALVERVESAVRSLRRAFGHLARDEKDERLRATIAKSLGVIGGVDDIPSIAACLTDDDARVRANAIEGLERIGHPRAYPYITHFLADDDHRIRANVVKALQSYGKRNIETMLAEMMGSEHVWMRDSAAYCLAVIATEDMLPLLDMGMRDPERSVRSKIRTALERLAARGSDEARRRLGAFSERTAVFEISSTDIFEALSDGSIELSDLNHEKPSRRIDAVGRIAARRDPAFTPLLLEQLKEEESPLVSLAIIDALDGLCDSGAIAVLARKLRDEDAHVARKAAFLMMKLGFDEAAPFVTQALAHPSEEVRGEVFVRLLTADPELAVTQLLTLCRSEKTSHRRKALACFEYAGRSESAAPFLDRLDGPALGMFREEREEELFEPEIMAYAAVSTRKSLDEFFMLVAEYEAEARKPDHVPRRGERPVVVKLRALGEARKALTERHGLSPEELGTLAGKAEAALRARSAGQEIQ